MKTDLEFWRRHSELLEAELAAMCSDAERYRWLRGHHSWRLLPLLPQAQGAHADAREEFDSAIDEAMAREAAK